VIIHNTAITASRALDLHMVIQFQFEDRKIVEVWESPDDIDAFTDFWRTDGVTRGWALPLPPQCPMGVFVGLRAAGLDEASVTV
jgi:hypothetical protein